MEKRSTRTGLAGDRSSALGEQAFDTVNKHADIGSRTIVNRSKETQ
jgi:hypothetical protein